MEDKSWGQIYWVTALHGGLIIRSCQRQGGFVTAFSSNLKTVIEKFLLIMEG